MEISFIQDTQLGVADNLLTPEECNELVEMTKWARERDVVLAPLLDKDIDDGRNIEFLNEYWRSKNSLVEFYPSHYKQIVDKLNEKANEAFTTYLNLINSPEKAYNKGDLSFVVIHRLQAGENLGVHDDQQDYGFVFYLNDGINMGEFSGGELHFREPNVTLSPVQGRLVIQPGHLEHEVFEVKEGERYSMTAFLMMVK